MKDQDLQQCTQNIYEDTKYLKQRIKQLEISNEILLKHIEQLLEENKKLWNNAVVAPNYPDKKIKTPVSNPEDAWRVFDGVCAYAIAMKEPLDEDYVRFYMKSASE